MEKDRQVPFGNGSDDETDDRCDLDPSKICDNCMRCVFAERERESDYAQILIDAVYENGEDPDEDPDSGYGTGEDLPIAGAEELAKYADEWKDI